jgi:hypothetical protein
MGTNATAEILATIVRDPLALVGESKLRGDNDYVAKATAFEVASREDYDKAAMIRTALKRRLGVIEDTFGTFQTLAHNLHKAICSKRKEFDDPVNQAEKILKRKMEIWVQRDMERQRLEQKRIEEENRKVIEDQRVESALAAEAAGDHEAAAEIVSQPVVSMAAAAPRPVKPTTPNSSLRMVWAWRYTDADTADPGQHVKRTFLKVDEPKISRTVKAMGKEAESAVGGIIVFDKPDVAARR